MLLQPGATAVKRPTKLSGIDSSFSEFVTYIAGIVNDNHVLWVSVTAPLVDASEYSHAIHRYFKILGSPYDSLISVERIQRYLLDDNGPFELSL